MSFDDRLRDALRRSTQAHELAEDDALRHVLSARATGAAEPAVVALQDVEPARRRGMRPRRVVGAAAALALLAGAIAVPLALQGGSHNRAVRRVAKHVAKKQGDSRQALLAVTSALDATKSAGSFRVDYNLSATPASAPATITPPPAQCQIVSGALRADSRGTVSLSAGGSGTDTPPGPPATACIVTPPAQGAVTVSGTGIINADPFAMVAASDVSSFGPVTVRVDDTYVWEYAGENSLSAGLTDATGSGSSAGTGTPISGFAGLAESTLGRREGAVAMMSLSSPTGYLSITSQAVTGAEKIGTGSVEGTPVTNYRVSIDPALLAGVPGLSTEESKAIADALAVLHGEGFTGNTTEISVDSNGYVLHTLAVNTFADGGTVTSDDTFSEFGCAGIVQIPGAPVTPTTITPTTGAPSCVDTATTPTTASGPTATPTTWTTASGLVPSTTAAPTTTVPSRSGPTTGPTTTVATATTTASNRGVSNRGASTAGP